MADHNDQDNAHNRDRHVGGDHGDDHECNHDDDHAHDDDIDNNIRI